MPGPRSLMVTTNAVSSEDSSISGSLPYFTALSIKLLNARFKAKGCVPAMACASRLAEMVTGIDVAAARNLTREELVESLGGLPEASTHAGQLAMDALREALSRIPIR